MDNKIIKLWKSISDMTEEQKREALKDIRNYRTDKTGYDAFLENDNYFDNRPCNEKSPCSEAAFEDSTKYDNASKIRHLNNAIRYARILEKTRQHLKQHNLLPKLIEEIESEMRQRDFGAYLKKKMKVGKNIKFDKSKVIIEEDEN